MLKRDLKNKISNSSNDVESVDIRDLEELSSIIDSDMVVVDEASTVLNTVENQVEVLNENIDAMSPMEIGKAIGAIETNLDRVTPTTNNIDCESIDTVKRDLEAISDSIKKAWEAVKKFFSNIWYKIKLYYQRFIIWIRGDVRKLSAKLNSLKNAELVLKPEYIGMNSNELYTLISTDIGDSLLFHHMLCIDDIKSDSINNSKLRDISKMIDEYMTVLDVSREDLFWSLYKSSLAEYAIPSTLPTKDNPIKVTGIRNTGFKIAKFKKDYSRLRLEYLNSFDLTGSISDTHKKKIKPLIASNIINNTNIYIDLFDSLLLTLDDFKVTQSLIIVNDKYLDSLNKGDINYVSGDVNDMSLGTYVSWSPRVLTKTSDEEIDRKYLNDLKIKAMFMGNYINGSIGCMQDIENAMGKYIDIINKYMIKK